MTSRLHRSYLFVPGNRPDRFDKASSCGADAVIIDLEDSVPPEDKTVARANLAGWLRAEHQVLVRINDARSKWFRDDLQLCTSAGVAGIVLPKAEHVEHVSMLHFASMHKPVYPLIESAEGIENARAIARTPGVGRLMFGTIDFQADMGINGDDEELLYFRSELVLASRLASIGPPIDGVTVETHDIDILREHTVRARRIGFGGKLCIHPRQIEHVNAFFAPSPEDVAWARRVVDATGGSDSAAVALDGQMVDRPVILKALQVLAEHDDRSKP